MVRKAKGKKPESVAKRLRKHKYTVRRIGTMNGYCRKVDNIFRFSDELYSNGWNAAIEFAIKELGR